MGKPPRIRCCWPRFRIESKLAGKRKQYFHRYKPDLPQSWPVNSRTGNHYYYYFYGTCFSQDDLLCAWKQLVQTCPSNVLSNELFPLPTPPQIPISAPSTSKMIWFFNTIQSLNKMKNHHGNTTNLLVQRNRQNEAQCDQRQLHALNYHELVKYFLCH